MQVRELNKEQLLELKWKVFYDLDDEWLCIFSRDEKEAIKNEVDNAKIGDEISDETIYKIYEGIDFVDEDFISSELPTRKELCIDSSEYNNKWELNDIINEIELRIEVELAKLMK